MESQFTPPEELPRNKQTEAIHNHETFWQIYLPLALGLIVSTSVCALSAFAAAGGGTSVSGLWASISLVFLILQTVIMLLVPLVLLVSLIYVVQLILRYTPPYFKQAQDFMGMVALQTKIVSGYIVQPMSAVKAATGFFEELANEALKRGGSHGRK